ncbi:hypothetical protein MSPP1_002320 [Malassezia sp. CBS 17886]|nr:hypothetical protein MSPP1_002320 [Malassezia sp. CBS 17886]
MGVRAQQADGPAVWDPAHWDYLAEGGANVILRAAETIPLDSFVDQVLAHLLPRTCLPNLSRVRIQACIGAVPADAQITFLKQIAARIYALRPAKRRARGHVSLHAQYLWLMDDYCGRPTHDTAPTLAVEIKGADHFHAFHSWYNPIDLYSGDRSRVQCAVRTLCDEWFQEHRGNLTVFCAGERASTASLAHASLDAEQVQNAVLHGLLSAEGQAVLHALKEAQRQLDPCDIEGIERAWKLLTGKSLARLANGGEWPVIASPCPTSDEIVAPDEPARPQLSEERVLMTPIGLEEYVDAVRGAPLDTAPATFHGLRRLIVAHMLSATLKDASAFFTFHAHETLEKIRLVDLDPKPIASMNMIWLTLVLACLVAAAQAGMVRDAMGGAHMRYVPGGAHVHRRDASSERDVKAGSGMTEGESHSSPDVPAGAQLISIPVGSGRAKIATYWTKGAVDKKADSAYIMIHGKLRDGDNYWTVMNNALKSAVKAGVSGASKNAIVVAPQFYSKKLNSGQYDKNTLAWAEVNTWQSGESAIHPKHTSLSSFDALDALVEYFGDASHFPNMRNLTLVGHGGGAQLMGRYAIVGSTPSKKDLHVRYIVGDPSSMPYFTKDRPVTDKSIASIKQCGYYNEWRYGFNNFNGTHKDGKKSQKDYFAQYIQRDVVNIVGYHDTSKNGDQKCAALLQGGYKRRDRNLSWWRYINMLAGTKEDLKHFPGNFSHLPDWSDASQGRINTRLVVAAHATHNASEVFGGKDGRSALFSVDVKEGWRPKGWTAQKSGPAPAASSVSSSGASSSGASSSGASSSPASSSPASSSPASSSPASSSDASSRTASFALCIVPVIMFLAFV